MNPYKTIWLSPKQTFEEFVVKNENQALFVPPFVVMGLIFGLNIAAEFNQKVDAQWIGLSIGIPLGIGFSFLIAGFVVPGLVKLFGKIWQGEATLRQLANVYAIAYIPFSLMLIPQVIMLFLGGDGTIEQVNKAVATILSLWSLGMLVIGVSRVQRFSYKLALFNILIIFLPFLIYGLLTGKA